MNKLKSTTAKTSTIFFIIVLIGAVNAISPLFNIGVQAQTAVPTTCKVTDDTINGVGAESEGIAYDPVN